MKFSGLSVDDLMALRSMRSPLLPVVKSVMVSIVLRLGAESAVER